MKNSASESCVLNKQGKQNLFRFRRVNWKKTWFFRCIFSLKIWIAWKTSNSEVDLKIIFFIHYVFLPKKLSKSDQTKNFQFKLWHVIISTLNLTWRTSFLHWLTRFEVFASKFDFFLRFPGYSIRIVNVIEECEEFATSFCMIIGVAYFFVVSSTFVWLMMAVRTISFALPFRLFKALWVAKKR